MNCIILFLFLIVSPFLTGRGLWTASKFSDVMQPEVIRRLVAILTISQ